MVPNEETQAMDARLQEQVKAMQATQGRFVIAFAAVAFVLHWGWETAHGRAYVETNLPLVQRFWHCFPMAVVDTAWSGAVVLLAAAVARTLRRPSSIWPAAAAAGALTAVAVERFQHHRAVLLLERAHVLDPARDQRRRHEPRVVEH